MMKRTFWIICFFLLTAVIACEKINDLIAFNIKNETDISIPSQSGLNIPFDIRSPEVKTSSEQTFQNNNTKAELVESAHLSELQITITAPEDQNFDFLNEINLYIIDEEGKQELIAYKKDIPEDGRQVLKLETTSTNLKPYVQMEAYSIRTEAKTDKVVNHQVDMKINMTFRIKAKIF